MKYSDYEIRDKEELEIREIIRFLGTPKKFPSDADVSSSVMTTKEEVIARKQRSIISNRVNLSALHERDSRII